jgi:hypothetical protein
MLVLFHRNNGFGIGEEEDGLSFGKREIGVRLVGGIRDAADGADHHDVHFGNDGVFALERIHGDQGGVVFFGSVILDAVAVVVVVIVGVLVGVFVAFVIVIVGMLFSFMGVVVVGITGC